MNPTPQIKFLTGHFSHTQKKKLPPPPQKNVNRSKDNFSVDKKISTNKKVFSQTTTKKSINEKNFSSDKFNKKKFNPPPKKIQLTGWGYHFLGSPPPCHFGTIFRKFLSKGMLQLPLPLPDLHKGVSASRVHGGLWVCAGPLWHYLYVRIARSLVLP